MAREPVVVRVPGDKSLSHRALLFGALADGRSRVEGLLDAADTRSTAGALRALGVAVPRGLLGAVTIDGVGLRGLRTPAGPIDCGNSGTTARLLLGLLAGSDVDAVLTGDASLRRRPMRRVTAPLAEAGARFDELEEPDRLPIRVRGGPLGRLDVHNARSSAQVKTAMLLAGLAAGSAVRVVEPGRSRDHTERLLRAMGARLTSEERGDGFVASLEPTDRIDPLDFRVPGDLSSAAFFLALGALRGPVTVPGVGINPSRAGVLAVLRRMQAGVRVVERGSEAGEPVGDVTVAPGDLRGTVVGKEEVPTLLDEIPVLAAVAARANGETRFEGIAELRVKESDRIDAVVRNLTALDVEAEAGPDSMMIRGTDRPLRGRVQSFGDHRIAMAFGVLAALPGSEITVRGRDDVGISYPDFWTVLDRVTPQLGEP